MVGAEIYSQRDRQKLCIFEGEFRDCQPLLETKDKAILVSKEGDITIRKINKGMQPEIAQKIYNDFATQKLVQLPDSDIIFASEHKINYFKPFEAVLQNNIFKVDLKRSSYDS